MDRRGFLQSLIGGVAVTAAVQTWPFRVYSFASEIKIATPKESVDFLKAHRIQYQGDKLISVINLQPKPAQQIVLPSAAGALDRPIAFPWRSGQQSELDWLRERDPSLA